MIPKKIHYCWFGGNNKGNLIEKCIKSWHKYCPDYEIIEWNEQNFDVHQSSFSKKMHSEKKWAFVADYARFVVLEKYGGFYLDTDMELFKSLDNLLSNNLVLGEEEKGIISAGAIGANVNNNYISLCKKYYDENPNVLKTVPMIMTEIFKSLNNKENILALPPLAFYPYSQQTIKNFNEKDLSNETYGVHHWNYSWGNPLLRTLNKFSFYHLLKTILDKLGLKKSIKKILGLA